MPRVYLYLIVVDAGFVAHGTYRRQLKQCFVLGTPHCLLIRTFATLNMQSPITIIHWNTHFNQQNSNLSLFLVLF